MTLESKWKKIIKNYETPTVFKEKLLKSYFKKLNIKEPVLDLGCGTGYFTELIANRGLKIEGFDQNPIKIKSSVRYSQGEASKTSFCEESFNTILLINVLSCVDSHKKRIKILLEAKRIKKPEGKIYVINTSEDLFKSPLNSDLVSFNSLNKNKVLLSVKKVDNNHISFEDYILTKEDMRNYAKVAGLKIIQIKDFFDNEINRNMYSLYVLQ